MTSLSRPLPHHRSSRAPAAVVRGRPRSVGARRRVMSLEALERSTILWRSAPPPAPPYLG